ncbi:solute carrier family 35 member C2 [Strongylocentrotus purpuratus]|uniref:Sugar phosphate transporter domain-containing protein n=1 Tax=Strongylocentrotus purpuratus TaxID=7668 RepID=A0A7M7NQV2_STRPU|nr:solute carrier family 35 member C2 [Strongylocentrotus purpuratus]XP_030840344.1 solute carrier family 35 member C2 [Strongylocentrotus purpuratus]
MMAVGRKPPNMLERRVNKTLYKISPPKLVKSRWMEVFLMGIKVIALVLFYYTFSISLTFYNKWLFHDFKFPLTITIIHLAVKFVIALILRSLIQACTSIKPVSLSWLTYAKIVTPTGITSALDIGFSNWSLVFITISLYTMCKSSAIIFILVFAIAFGLQKPHWMQVIIVVLIAVGLFMFTYESTQFNLEGFVLVLAASFLSGLRWSLAQILTQKEETGLRNPIDIIYHLQPVMILGLLPLAIAVEGVRICSTEDFLGFTDIHTFTLTCTKLLFGACLAFMLAMSEYLLLSRTSTLTLSISGIFKEICTLYIASQKGDEMSALNFIGMVVCLCGISLHVGLKALETKRSSENPSHDVKDDMESLINDDSSDEQELYVRKIVVTKL